MKYTLDGDGRGRLGKFQKRGDELGLGLGNASRREVASGLALEA